MMIIISPAKTLDLQSDYLPIDCQVPFFIKEANLLIDGLKRYATTELKSLMGISDSLAQLNTERIHQWQKYHREENSRPAIFTYKGDVFQGLQIEQYSEEEIKYAQNHLRILSGLYGILKPMDLIQAHRLEMGTNLSIAKHKNLYEFWGVKITEALSKAMENTGSTILLNLASQEYSKSLQLKQMQVDVISPRFLDFHQGNYKMISFFAKKARGLMASYVIKNRIKDVEDLKLFNADHYSYNESLSRNKQPCFTRD